MKILERYIGKTVVSHTAIVMAVLLSLYFFSAFVTEMAEVGKGSYSFWDALRYTLLLLPRQAYELFPLVALLGTMLGLGALANTSELTVMRAAGVSVRRVVVAVLKIGALMIVTVAVLGEGIAPHLEKIARTERAKELSRNLSLNTKDGLWARDGDTFINIKRLLPGDDVANEISLYRFDGHRLTGVVSAGSATYEDDAWQLEDVFKTNFRDDRVEAQVLANETWSSALTPFVINMVAVPPENLSAWDLYEYMVYMDENNLDSKRYELSMWVRLIAPLATGGMVLLAVPFVFGSLRSVSIGQRIMVGALIGIAFYMFNAVFARIGLIYDLPPLLAAASPTVVVYAAWVSLMRRIF